MRLSNPPPGTTTQPVTRYPVSRFDVQTRFNRLDTKLVQKDSEYLNVQGSDPDNVTIFDVQSLFAEST